MSFVSLNTFKTGLSIKKMGNRKTTISRCKAEPNYGYSDQSFEDVNTMLVKYFTFRSVQYTMGQVYALDTSLMKLEFNWLCDFANENKPSSGDAFIEALYDAGKPEFANRIMANRDGLMRQWLYETNATGGLDIGIEMTKHNMEVSRKQLDKSFNATPEPNRSLDEV
tara:strand:+ start:25 stop:525 length:501 start_codon:yes stop_codon:yes gene_type:complete